MKAPIGRRITAYLIDLAVSIAVAAVPVLPGAFIYLSFGGSLAFMAAAALVLTGLIAYVAYWLVRDALNGGMGVGKKYVGLRVVKGDGSRCDMMSSLMRNVTFFIPILRWFELILPFTDREGYRVGDILAGTQVVE